MCHESNKNVEGTHCTNKLLLVLLLALHLLHLTYELRVFLVQLLINSGFDTKTFHKHEKENNDQHAYNENIEHTPLCPHSPLHPT